jgi:hypothetical protein
MKIINISESTKITSSPSEFNDIHIFTQFFIHSNTNRQQELNECLLKNFYNPSISKIHLLTERNYSYQEMGFSDDAIKNDSDKINDKILQTNIGKRLKFQHVFHYIRVNEIKGFLVLVNSDIFFDSSIEKLISSTIHEEKKMFALLRYEYCQHNQEESKLFGPRFDSQDTWIFHSNTIMKENQEKIFNFEFGKPGCDNKIVYLMNILGYKVINDPIFIKTFHNHASLIRNYSNSDVVKQPWGVSVPYGVEPTTIPKSLGIDLKDVMKQNLWFEDNIVLGEYIHDNLQKGIPFIIPRIAGIENNFAVFAKIRNEQNKRDIDNYFQQVNVAMKNNAGIKLSNSTSIEKYSKLYLEAFDNCQIYFGWDVQGNCINHISHSHEYMKHNYTNKKMLWAISLDVFDNIHSNPWTQSLRGKRILIVSSFIESIKKQILVKDKLFDGIDLFPDCTFVFIKPPTTNGGMVSEEFDKELDKFYIELDKMKDDYDVALLSCGGYGNIISNHIFKNHNKSAIYVGCVLQMFFGIYGNRWLVERGDIMRLYLNKYWVRPCNSEKPQGHEKIEKSCYW